jgi:hypothetical protein
MALTLLFPNTAITADCGQVTIEDQTVYGGTELLRSQVALYVLALKKGLPTEDDEQLVVTPNNNNPVTDTIWYFPSTLDGWHIAKVYAVPVYDAGASYIAGQVVYSGGYIWSCLLAVSGVAPGEDPTYWSIIEIDDAAVEASNNVQYDYFDYLITCRSEKGYAQAVACAAKEGCCGDCPDSEARQLYQQLDVLLNSAFSLCTQLKYAEGEEVIRNITDIIEDSNCVCS